MTAMGRVYLVGAGPGDPGLITMLGHSLLAAADVVLHDRLSNPALLAVCRPDAELINVGKTPGGPSGTQAEINALLVARAQTGKTVVRLKGGDPFVFGRGYEELEACRAADVPCMAVPGVSSALAGPASAGIPVTHREIARSFAVITGNVTGADAGPTVAPHDYAALARIDTLVILMGRAGLTEIAAQLIAAGRAPDTPAACVQSATLTEQRVVRGTLATIAEIADRAGLQAPIVTVVSATAAMSLDRAGFDAPVPIHATLSRAACGTDLRSVSSTEDRRDVDEAGAQRASAKRSAGSPSHSLAGRRLALTQAATATGELRRLLHEARATLVDLPLIEVRYPQPPPVLDLSGSRLADWLAFTSVHGVRGLRRCLAAAGKDARALHGVRIAAIGPGTARELQSHGLRADLLAPTHSSHGLLAALRETVDLSGARILCPHGSEALPTLAAGLRAAGALVTTLVAYETHPATPSPAALAGFASGVDAVLFCSPTAIRQYHALGLSAGGAALACIGPTTAETARTLGYEVQVEPKAAGSAGLVTALRQWFASADRPM